MNSYGPLIVSGFVLAVWLWHAVGMGPVWSEADLRLMDSSMMLVLGYWLGSSHIAAPRP